MEKAGKYEILRQIGSGGYGVVYEGRDPFIKRRVAIKACTSEEEEIRQRFYGEAEIVGNLEHTNITTVHDFGLENGVPYLVQEYLTGEDLDHMIERQESMTLARKLDILAQVAEGLGYAHSQGVIHRDIKPGNIRVLEDGRIKIMDFGIAKLKDHKSSLTRTGTTVGTAAYLPPEQIRGQATDHRADVFSFGVTAYELLAGRRPFEAPTLAAMLYKILGNDPTPLAEALPDAPRRLLALIHACLEKDPDQRCPSFREVAAELAAARLELGREQGGEDGKAAVAAPAAEEPVDAEKLQQRVRAALAVGDVSAAELLILRARHGPPGAIPDGLFERLLAEAAAVRMQQGVERHRGEKVEELLRRVRELQHPQGYQEALRLLQAASDLAPRNEAVRVLQAATVAGLQREGEAERARALREIADAIAAGNLKQATEALAAAEDAHGEDAELSALRRRAQEVGIRQQSDQAAAQRRGSRVASGAEMDPFVGAPLLQALRQLRTTPGGTLHLENLGIRLYLREGDLCVAAGDPLVREVMTPATPERPQAWLRRLDAWRGEPVRVTAAPPASHITLAAFTPLAPLLMAAAAGGKSDSELERELLPEDFEIAAAGVRDLRNVTGLETHDAFVLSRLETPQRLDTLVGLTGLGRGEVVRRLARLAALGWVRAIAPGTWTPAAATESLPDLLSPRILEDLQQNPLRLSTLEHRQRLHRLVARFGGCTHYELLGLDPHAESAQIHPAFLELARVVHPTHAGRLALGAEAGATLQLIFERACGAYNVLSDQQRRDRYDAEIGVSAATAPQAAEARMTERRELARSFFEQASARARDEDYHFAIELLRQAVRADPRPEYWMLLASCLMRNPKWLAQALHAARQAARQRPSDLELRTLLGEIHERMGESEQATQQFREALELDPGNIAASEGMARLAAAKDARSSSARVGQPQPAGAGPGRPRVPAKRPYRG